MPRPKSGPGGSGCSGVGFVGHGIGCQLAAVAMAFSTARARGSDRYFCRKATGSAFAATASSSMNDSLAKVFEKPPRVRRAVVRGNTFVVCVVDPLVAVVKLRTELLVTRR